MIISFDPQKHITTAAMLVALRCVLVPNRAGGAVWQLGPRPADDRPRPLSYRFEPIRVAFPVPAGARIRCRNFFSPGGGLDWHTDSDSPGWRIYVFRGGAGTSTFRYQDQVFEEGATGAYVFEVGSGYWHAVESYRQRWSCGMQVPETFAQKVIAAVS